MWNAGLDEAQAGIKIARININNLRYADDTTLMAESEEELKSLLMKVKEDSEKPDLKLNIQKTKIMASGSITSWQIDGETMETVTDFIFLSKVAADGDWSLEIWRNLVLERTLESLMDSKEIKPGLMLRLKLQYFGHLMQRIDSLEKTRMLGGIGGRRRGMTEDEMAGWHHQLDTHEFGWTPGVGDGQGGLACCDLWGHKESDTTEQLNWTEIFWFEYVWTISCLHLWVDCSYLATSHIILIK